MDLPDPAFELTRLISEAASGQEEAVRRLLPLIYEELHALAARYMDRERPDHTLQPTALVHEAYLRLVHAGQTHWHDRGQFFALAALAMRNILVDHARRRRAEKRGGRVAKVPLDRLDPDALTPASVDVWQDDYLVGLDEALRRLAEFDPQLARLVELRFFAGLTVEQAADVLGVSPRTVKREWQVARAWLHRAVTRGESDEH